MDDMKIDLIITYVDSENEDWLNNYANQKEISYLEYFKTNKNTLKYLLRSVDMYLPFIHQIFLIVQNISEVPDYIDTEKIKIITHNEFIPKEYLPTFNSNTIESFFQNIEDLSEHFLYMNDDQLILNELSASQFYSNDQKAITYFYPRQFKNAAPDGFDEILIKNNKLIWDIDSEEALNKGYTICMNHTIRPYFKSLYRECYNKYWDKIAPTLTNFRSSKNYNLYIVDNYQNKMHKEINALTFVTNYIANNYTNLEIKTALSLNANFLCIYNIDANIDIYENEVFIQFLNSKFTTPSKYEKGVK